MNDHNTFDRPDAVTPKAMSRMPVKDNVLKVTLPPMSVSAIKVK
jgi:alpha-L-arabinofuranosidase